MARKLIPLIALALILGVALAPGVFADSTKMLGTVAEIDKANKTFTLKADEGEQTHRFETKDAGLVNKLKKGQHVEVTYRKGSDASQLIAESAVDKPRKAAAKKK